MIIDVTDAQRHAICHSLYQILGDNPESAAKVAVIQSCLLPYSTERLDAVAMAFALEQLSAKAEFEAAVTGYHFHEDDIREAWDGEIATDIIALAAAMLGLTRTVTKAGIIFHPDPNYPGKRFPIPNNLAAYAADYLH